VSLKKTQTGSGEVVVVPADVLAPGRPLVVEVLPLVGVLVGGGLRGAGLEHPETGATDLSQGSGGSGSSRLGNGQSLITNISFFFRSRWDGV